MLVLTRKVDEGIAINGEIEVVVLGVEDGKVKLGVKAPKDIKVYRKEVLEAIRKENKEASNINEEIFNFLSKNHKKD